jgi:hypothetical protein
MKRSVVITTTIVILFLLGIALPAAAGDKSPLVGKWQAVDGDGSNITLTITQDKGSAGRVFNISGTDDATGIWCSTRGAAEMKGIGLLNEENILTTQLIWWCLPPGNGYWPWPDANDNLSLYTCIFEYRPASDTIRDTNCSIDSIYSRAEDEQ